MTLVREAGWYRDPDSPLQHRYWTGEAWQDAEPPDPLAADAVAGADLPE